MVTFKQWFKFYPFSFVPSVIVHEIVVNAVILSNVSLTNIEYECEDKLHPVMYVVKK